MADLQESTPGLKNNEKDLEHAVEETVGKPATLESASAENLEALPAEVSEVRGEMAAAIEAPAEPTPQQDLGAVLEGHSAQGVANLESKAELSDEAKNLSDFLSGKVPAGDLQLKIKPNSDSPDA